MAPSVYAPLTASLKAQFRRSLNDITHICESVSRRLSYYEEAEYDEQTVYQLKQAVYGVQYALATGRTNGSIDLWLCSLSNTAIIDLFAEVAEHCQVIAEVPRYLNSLTPQLTNEVRWNEAHDIPLGVKWTRNRRIKRAA